MIQNLLFNWLLYDEQTFKKVKKAVTEEPVLVQFDSEKEMTIKMDASDYAISMSMT